MMLGYLLGRAGVDVVVLEKHADFFRDFRGDTVHPSTLQVMDELGLIDGFLKLPHQRLQKMEGMFGGESVRIADLSRLNVKYPFIAFMPQWDFLNFLRESGKRFASLKVMMSTEAIDLIRDGERIAGVKAKTPDGVIDIEADLTIACDGRHSLVRERAGLEVEEIGAPMDVLWFRAGKRADETENLFARVDPGKMMVTFDRGDYWQCAYVIAKGQYDAVKARGLPALLDDIARMAPILKSGLADVKSWDDVKLLTVAINRLKRWTRPGLLCIGDAAHAMSPIGGVGVNLAVQDAVATANLLASKLANGCPPEDELDAVRRRREFPVRMTQRMQVVAQNNIVNAALKPGNAAAEGPARACGWSPPCPGCRASRRGLSASACGPSMCSRHVAPANEPMLRCPGRSPAASPGLWLCGRKRRGLRHDRISAVDGNRRARDEIGRGRGEEHRDAGEIVDRAPARRRRARQHPVVQAVDLLARALGEVGVDPARQHRVDLDVVGGPGAGAGARELHDAALARGIGRREAGAEDRHHRADIDDLAAAGRLHRRIDRLRAQEGAGEVGLDHAVPLGDVERVRRLADVDAGVVDEDVDAAELAGDALDHGGDRGLVGDVGGHGDRLGAGLLELRDGGGRFRFVAADDRDRAPASASPRAMPSPMPPLPPVTMATLPLRSKSSVFMVVLPSWSCPGKSAKRVLALDVPGIHVFPVAHDPIRGWPEQARP